MKLALLSLFTVAALAAPGDEFDGCSSSCCVAGRAHIALLNACPFLNVTAATNVNSVFDGSVTATAPAFCSSPCYRIATATLRVAAAGRIGEGCGVLRSYLMLNAVACDVGPRTNATCMSTSLDLIARGSSAFASRAVRQGKQDTTSGALDAVCASDCYAHAMGVFGNLTRDIATSFEATGVSATFTGNNLPSALQQKDFFADLAAALAIAPLGALMSKRCAKDTSSGQYCALRLGADYELPSLEGNSTAGFALLAAMSNPSTAFCGSCGTQSLSAEIAKVQSMELLWGILVPQYPEYSVAAYLIFTYGSASLQATLAWDLQYAGILEHLLGDVSLMCGAGQDGRLCITRANDMDPVAHPEALSALGGLGYCLPFIKNPAAGTCSAVAPYCAQSLATIQSMFGCCFWPILVQTIWNPSPANANLLATMGVLLNGTSLNVSVISSLSTACGADLSPCTGGHPVTLRFRLLNLKFHVVNGTAFRASFMAAVQADVAEFLNLLVTNVHVTALADGGSDTSVVVTVTAVGSSDAVTSALTASAQSSVASGSVQFFAVNQMAQSSPDMTPDSSQGVAADSNYAVSPASPNTSGALAAAPSGSSALALALGVAIALGTLLAGQRA